VHDDKCGDYVCACECGKLICAECEPTYKNNPFVSYDGWRMCKDCATKEIADKYK
jgi:hypothetical protein